MIRWRDIKPQFGVWAPADNHHFRSTSNPMKPILPAFLAVAFLSTVPASAQTPADPAMTTSTSSASGVVVSTTTNSVVVRLSDGTLRTFATDASTTMPSVRLTEGNRVTVQHHSLAGGLFHATTIVDASLQNEPVVSSSPADRRFDSTTTDRTTTDGAATAERARTENQTRRTNSERSLPETATPMPLLALAGGLALATGLLMSALRRIS